MPDIFHKEVDFKKYCEKCKHKSLKGNEEPCDSCLSESTNYGTDKPVKFEEKVKRGR